MGLGLTACLAADAEAVAVPAIEASEAALVAAAPGELYLAGEQRVEACANTDLTLKPSQESCYFWHRLKVSGAGACAAGRCDKLVVYFSGGDQACALPGAPWADGENAIYGTLAKSYADRGYLFVCANLFQTPFTPDAGRMPYAAEAPRVKALVDAILASPAIARRWSGKDLLFSGISHGATAPVLAMARAHVDRDARWRGTRKTGACFLDGQYDVYFNQQFWMAEARKESCGWFHRRSVCGRYLGLGFCGESTRAPGMDADSIVMTDPDLAPKQSARLLKSVTAADFAVPQFRLVECGSGLPSAQSCELHGNADLLPAPPIRALCNVLNAGGPAHHCELASLPGKSHSECGLAGVADVQCLPWFDALPGRP